MERPVLGVLLGLALGACRTATPALPRYIVSATPLALLGPAHPGLCIAVDPRSTHGIWWWDAGPTGCAMRVTGPTVFPAQRATVATVTGSGAIEARFNLQLHVGERDVRLVLQDGQMRETTSGLQVATARRADLDIPPAYGR